MYKMFQWILVHVFCSLVLPGLMDMKAQYEGDILVSENLSVRINLNLKTKLTVTLSIGGLWGPCLGHTALHRFPLPTDWWGPLKPLAWGSRVLWVGCMVSLRKRGGWKFLWITHIYKNRRNTTAGTKDGLGNQGVSAHFSCSFLAANGLIMIKYRSLLKPWH